MQRHNEKKISEILLQLAFSAENSINRGINELITRI